MDSPGSNVTLLAAPPEPTPEQHPEGSTPWWVDFAAVDADLSDDGVAAPAPYVEGLRTVVADARSKGLDLKVVYTEAPAVVYTQARDLATALSRTHEGTILVRTPMFVGSVSDTVPRARLEAGQDDAYRESDPVWAATVFSAQALRPAPPWGAYAGVVLLVLVLALAGFAYLVRRRRG